MLYKRKYSGKQSMKTAPSIWPITMWKTKTNKQKKKKTPSRAAINRRKHQTQQQQQQCYFRISRALYHIKYTLTVFTPWRIKEIQWKRETKKNSNIHDEKIEKKAHRNNGRNQQTENANSIHIDALSLWNGLKRVSTFHFVFLSTFFFLSRQLSTNIVLA